jgi:hypothetical protein
LQHLDDIAARHPGHDDVQEDQIRFEFPDRRQRVLGPVLHLNLVTTRSIEIELEQARGADFVIDIQDACFSHKCVPCRRRV